MFFRLLLLFILVPIAELAIFLTLGDKIGLGATLAIIILTGFLGAALTKSQGLRALERFRAASAKGTLPTTEIIDGLLILIAGAVLLTPGFLTDTVGFLLLVPPARAVIRKWLGAWFAKRVQVSMHGPGAAANPPQRPVSGKVIDVETVD
ncbi:MAG: FxsA family protein [Akkermansiaceae bacterium]|nr:FxsA family protein [Akkermansiaceae bacterium]